MKKGMKITYNVLVIVILNVTYFICNNYPKHILEFSSWYSLIATCLNLIFYILFFSIIIIFFKKGKTLFSNHIFNSLLPFRERFELKALSILLSVQIASDILNSFSVHFFEKYAYFVSSVLTIFNWFAIYFIATYEKENFFKSKKYFSAVLVTCIVIFGFCLFYDYKLFENCLDAVQKYEADSELRQNIITNSDFLSGFKNFIFDTLIGIVLVVFHLISFKEDEIQEQESLPSRKFVVFIVRIFSLLAISFLLLRVRVIIFPHSAIGSTGNSDIMEKHYVFNNSFYDSSTSFTLSRIEGYTDEKDVFIKTKIRVYCNQEEVAKFSVDGPYSTHKSSISGNVMTLTDRFNDYQINGQTFSILENLAICYFEDSNPKVVKFSDINKQDENPLLTDIIEQVVSEGNVSLLVNAYEYLKKYDYEFASGISKRYKSADFTDSEKSYINKFKYRIDYLQTFFDK